MSLNGLKDKNKEKEAENHPFKKPLLLKLGPNIRFLISLSFHSFILLTSLF